MTSQTINLNTEKRQSLLIENLSIINPAVVSFNQSRHTNKIEETAVFINSNVLNYGSEFLSSQLATKKFWKDLKNKQTLANLKGRLIECPYGEEFINVQCKDCKHFYPVTRLTCLSPFCQDEKCVENRIKLAQEYLKSFKIKSKNLLHIIFSFEFCDKFTDKIKNEQSRVFNLLKKKMMKKYGVFYMMLIRDINKKPNNQIHPHYHSATLPLKDWRLFRHHLFEAREEIIKETGTKFSIKFAPQLKQGKLYSNQFSLFRYFANRLAGVFGDLKKQNTFGYSDVMSLETYFKTFYNKTKIRLINIRRRVPTPEACVLAMHIKAKRLKCPNCDSTNLEICLTSQLYKPPSNQRTAKAIIQETRGLSLNDVAGSLASPDGARYKLKVMNETGGLWHGVDWVEKHKEFYPEFYPQKQEMKISKENLNLIKEAKQ